MRVIEGGTMNSSNFEKIIDLAAKDTEKGARVVAKVFYRILRKKGFSKNQIIDISTNVLNCLVESLQGYEKKVENVHENRKEPQKKMKRWKISQNRNSHHDYGIDQYQ